MPRAPNKAEEWGGSSLCPEAPPARGGTLGGSWRSMEPAPPGNHRVLVHAGILAKAGCLGKPETTAVTKELLV